MSFGASAANLRESATKPTRSWDEQNVQCSGGRKTIQMNALSKESNEPQSLRIDEELVEKERPATADHSELRKWCSHASAQVQSSNAGQKYDTVRYILDISKKYEYDTGPGLPSRYE